MAVVLQCKPPCFERPLSLAQIVQPMLHASSALHSRLSKISDLVLQKRMLRLIIEFRARIGYLRRSKVQLGLTEFDDRTQPQVIASLRQIQRQPSLVKQLGRQSDLLIGGRGV